MSNLVYIPTKFNKETFTIYACGKFGEESKKLTKAQASLLYIELHKFLTQNDDKTVSNNKDQ